MTYDSDNFIQHISYTLTAIAKKQGMAGAYEWAKKAFAVPMGIPDFYDYDETGIDVSARQLSALFLDRIFSRTSAARSLYHPARAAQHALGLGPVPIGC